MSLVIFYSEHNPFYAFLRDVTNFESVIFKVSLWTLTAILSFIATSVAFLANAIGLFGVANGIIVLYLWSLRVNELLVDTGFDVLIKIHKNLRVMCIIQEGLARDFISPCLHHPILVGESTVALYFLLKQFMKGGKVSMLVSAVAVSVIGAGFVNETFAIRYVAEASSAGKIFKREMMKKYGMDKYKRRVLRAMLPNCINLEFISSVDTIKNGIGMDYFIRYVERVVSHTMSLLLTIQ